MSCPNAGKRRKKCDKLRSAAEHSQGIAAATIALKYLNRSLLLLHWFGAFFLSTTDGERPFYRRSVGPVRWAKEALAGSYPSGLVC